ncbi:hypothetical protein NDGK_00221 [Clostridiales bacterium CHKCI001]|nr:hypothetical protein NDGK_00221 [Clostridiales bacterium CHKCI001]
MKRKLAGAISAVILLLSACGVEYQPTQSGVFIKLDKSLEGAYIEAFDNENYNIEDLEKMGQEEVQTYNKEQANLEFYSSEQTENILPISLDSVKKEGDNVVVRMSYQTAEDYSTFNADDIALAGGSTIYTENLSDTTIDLIGEFVTVTGETATIEEIMSHGDYQLVYVNYEADITVEGEVAYVSTNVNCNSKNNVNTPAGQDAYIIFKKASGIF